jgi:hypothetical protein
MIIATTPTGTPTSKPTLAPVERSPSLALLEVTAAAEDVVLVEADSDEPELEELAVEEEEKLVEPIVRVGAVRVALAAMSDMISVSVACYRTCNISAHAVGDTEFVTSSTLMDVKEGLSGSGPEASVDVEKTFVRSSLIELPQKRVLPVGLGPRLGVTIL